MILFFFQKDDIMHVSGFTIIICQLNNFFGKLVVYFLLLVYLEKSGVFKFKKLFLKFNPEKFPDFWGETNNFITTPYISEWKMGWMLERKMMSLDNLFSSPYYFDLILNTSQFDCQVVNWTRTCHFRKSYNPT